MGYELHITRSPRGDSGAPILEAEWHGVVEELGCLKPVDRTPLGLRMPDGWHAHIWIEHPESPDGVGPVFTLRGGELVVEFVDIATARLALTIAERLGATLIGDDGESYSGDELSTSTVFRAPRANRDY